MYNLFISFLNSIEKADVMRLILTIIGAFTGAFFAYTNQNRIIREKLLIDQASSCQHTLFQLGRLHENLKDIEKEIGKYKDDPDKYINIPIISAGEKCVDIDVKSLTFFLYDDEEDANIIYLIATIEREYKKLISIIDARNKIRERNDFSNLINENKIYTDNLYRQFDRCYTFSNEIRNKSFKCFKKKFKKARFTVGVTNVLKK